MPSKKTERQVIGAMTIPAEPIPLAAFTTGPSFSLGIPVRVRVDLPHTPCIYAIVNELARMVYVGSVSDTRARYYKHRRWFWRMWREVCEDNGKRPNSRFLRAAEAMPPRRFVFHVLEDRGYLTDDERLIRRENHWMRLLPGWLGFASYNDQLARLARKRAVQ
jgi:hypothetical protein